MTRFLLCTLIVSISLTACSTTPAPAPEPTPAPAPEPEDPAVAQGEIEALDIARALKVRETQISACYAAERDANPEAEGIVVVQFVIVPSEEGGRVTEALPVLNEVGGRAGECLAEEVLKLEGLPSPVGGPYRAALPFRFQLDP